MADEFAKGLAVFAGAGLFWMVLAGWYRTPSFEGAQLNGPLPSNPTGFDAIAIELMHVMLWFAVFGALTFWVLVPAGREVYARVQGE